MCCVYSVYIEKNNNKKTKINLISFSRIYIKIKKFVQFELFYFINMYKAIEKNGILYNFGMKKQSDRV